ncbi:MAG TPA: type 4a pilus biogenesis protein PilO [Acidimicrobiales bacterium]|nr:type 4a pilus biogenesis protein PilO [Acidimicrobiales bacterium]
MSAPSRSLARRPAVLVSVLGVAVLALAWWFAWMTPEGSKLASIHQQQITEQQTETRLDLRLVQLRAEAKQVQAAAPFLKHFATAIPSTPDAPDLVVQVYRLSVADGVSLQSVTDDSVQPSGLGYSTIPVALAVSGPHDQLLAFISDLYKMSRLLTIQSVSLSGNGNLNASSFTNYTASISATAYTTSVPKTPTGAS